MPNMAVVEPLVAAKVEAMGYELYECKFVRAGTRSVLRIFIDGPNGVRLSDCERVSRELAVVLDVENFSEAPYHLEISSPGLDRPLVSERDFKRAVGLEVTVRLRDEEGSPKSRSYRGKLTAVENANLSLSIKEKPVTIAVAAVLSGRIELKF